MIVLIGFMGAGKSTVGRAVADRLGLGFVDTDELVEKRAGASVADIFTTGGEGAFRELEREIAAEVLVGEDRVVALGGGAIGDPATCAALEWTTVVHLDVGIKEALKRVGSDEDRPLLAKDPRSLHAERRPLYERLADLTVLTDERAVADVVAEVTDRLRPPDKPRAEEEEGVAATDEPARVAVALGERSYDVIVGTDLVGRLPELVTLPPDAERAFVITHPELFDLAGRVQDSLAGAGLAVKIVVAPPGESSKSLDAAAHLYDELAAAHAGRRDLVVAVGGGVITDLAGFVASTLNRGMACLQVATTVTAQVDAAIGGKTGVNLEHGKNLVGTFHQPVAVICDVATLATLPEHEVRNGLAEVVKYGLIRDPDLVTIVEERASDLVKAEPDLMKEVVVRCARLKAGIVAADERDEAGTREWLNYGHTFGHAIEAAAGLGAVGHGEAVAVGMVLAARAARLLDRVNDACVDRHYSALEAVGLPVTLQLDFESLKKAWAHDKKYRRGVRFVLLHQPESMEVELRERGVGIPESGVEVPDEVLAKAIGSIAR